MRDDPVGQIRRSQAIMTFGPGALIDLPEDAAIMGGLDGWPPPSKLEPIEEPRLCTKLRALTGVEHPRLYAPPADDSAPWEEGPKVTAWRFPNWFLVQEKEREDGSGKGRAERSRRLVYRTSLDRKWQYEGLRVVPTRFVQACQNGHISDLAWRRFVHGPGPGCPRQMWLDERGTGGDLSDIVARCECGKSRPMSEAMELEKWPLGNCDGARPWLGRNAHESCDLPPKLLVRTATNAFFAQTVSVLSLPEARSRAAVAVDSVWDVLQVVQDAAQLNAFRAIPKVATAIEGLTDGEILDAIRSKRAGGKDEDRPVKLVELEAILAAPTGYQEDVPPDQDFYARRLPESVWRRSKELSAPIASVIQLHRVREVTAMSGFTRLEPLMPDIHGEYDSAVRPAQIALTPEWFPAIENRGEGIFVQVDTEAIARWVKRKEVKDRGAQLLAGYEKWKEKHAKQAKGAFVGLPYVLLHTLSHLVLQSLSLTCGYPASSIRERIYVGGSAFGFLLYTGTPDADGTLGGLVSEARNMERHLEDALREATLCSNDPICACHDAGASLEGRWRTGAACHGCCFLAETSCEMRNEYLDRVLVVPTLGHEGVAFFSLPE